MEGPEITFAEAVIDNGSLGTRTVRFETGRLAKQAGGAVRRSQHASSPRATAAAPPAPAPPAPPAAPSPKPEPPALEAAGLPDASAARFAGLPERFAPLPLACCFFLPA